MLSKRQMRLCGMASIGACLVGLAVVSQSTTLGQSGTRSRSGQQGSRAPFEQRFWNYLQTVHYKNWAPFPGSDGDFQPGEGPHGDFLKVYINRTAAGAPDELPYGSIIIKENYGQDRKTMMALTVMYRSKDYDPASNDWYWVKYEPDGRVSEMSEMRVAGQVKMCIECHSGAKGDDFVFAND